MYPFLINIWCLMKHFCIVFIPLLILIFMGSCKDGDLSPQKPKPKNFTLKNLQLDNQPLSYHYADASVTPEIVLTFAERIDHESAQAAIMLSSSSGNVPLSFSYSNSDSTI